MTSDRRVVVVIDPSEELVEGLGRIEDWLLYADPDDLEDEDALLAGARTAGALGKAVAEAAKASPELYTPDGRAELTAVMVVPGDLAAMMACLRRALGATSPSEPPSGTSRVLDLLDRAAMCSSTEDARTLAGVAGPGRTRVRLSGAEYQAYVRLVRVVLVDPLDRFIALPLCVGKSAPAPSPEAPAGPGMDL
ncbi:MAG: hypothetical protein ACRD0L_03870 [Acidimicrobiales bacterium]